VGKIIFIVSSIKGIRRAFENKDDAVLFSRIIEEENEVQITEVELII